MEDGREGIAAPRIRSGHRSAFDILVGILLGIMLAGICWGIWKTHSNSGSAFSPETREELSLIGMAISLDHEATISGIQKLLLGLSYFVEKYDESPELCDALLKRLHTEYPYISNIGIVSKDGAVTCSGVPLEMPVSFAEDADFIEMQQKDAFAISGYFISPITGRPSIRFLEPLHDANGLSGALYASISAEWMNAFPPTFDFPSTITITKFDKNGVVFMRYPDPLTWSGTNQAETVLFSTTREKEKGEMIMTGIDGIERFYSFRPIFHNGILHGYVAIGKETGTSE